MEQTNTNTSPEKEISTPPPLRIKQGLNKDFKSGSYNLIIGALGILIGIILSFSMPGVAGGPCIGVGIVLIITSLQAPLKFRESHFVFKKALATPSHKIEYSSIRKITYKKKRIVVSNQYKNIEIAKGLFNSNEWEEIIQLFKSIKSN